MSNFLIFNFFHPIVISEILSFSSKNSGKNFVKSNFLRNFALENKHKNLQISPEDANLSFENIKDQWFESIKEADLEKFRFIVKNYDVNVNVKDAIGSSALNIVNNIFNSGYVSYLWHGNSYRKNHDEIFDILMKMDNINFHAENEGSSFVRRIIYGENVRFLKKLLSHPDIDINLYNEYGDNILYLAAILNKTSFKIILENTDVDPNIKDKNGNTVLMVLAEHESSNYIGYESLHYIRNLFVYRPNTDVNIQNDNGDTALIIIAKNAGSDTSKIATLLLCHPNININIRNNENKTALMIAMEKNDLELIDLLEVYKTLNE